MPDQAHMTDLPALKFSIEDSLTTIPAKSDNQKNSITVTDKGIGISKKDQEHLFTMFYRASNVTNIQGTGPGLHIVKRFPDLINGTVDLQSTLGKGTFYHHNISKRPK